MPEPGGRWSMLRNVSLMAVAGMLAGVVVFGLSKGHGGGFDLKPSAFDPPASPSSSVPKPNQATVGKPRYVQRPPHVQLESNLLPTDGIPSVALSAYQQAASTLQQSMPACNIRWEDIAGIGRVESDNGQTNGPAARVTPGGTLFPPIYGPLLDGSDGFPAIASTDNGRLEGGGVWARAVGPLQFLPSTWESYAASDIGDSPPDPQNYYDAAYTAGIYLCTNGGDLSTPAGLEHAVYAYNHDTAYVVLVEQWVNFYEVEGESALLAAGTGLIPLGQPAQGGAPPTSQVQGIQQAAAISSAAAATDGTGSFVFNFQVFASQSVVATGSGGVDWTDRAAWANLALPHTGTVQLREVGGTTYVALPAGLARQVRAGSRWVVLSPAVLAKLPTLLAHGLGALGQDLVFVVAQLAGGTSTVQIAGEGTVAGVPVTEYFGTIDLFQASNVVNGGRQQLAAAAGYLGGSQLGVDVWVDAHGHVRSETLTLPAVPGAPPDTPFSVELFLSGFGRQVVVPVPAVTPVTTTTTTTTSTSTTTTTSTSTTTTSTTSTSTTSTSTTSTVPSGPSGTTGAGAPSTSGPGTAGTTGAAGPNP
jgi:hypothetical protein